MNYSQNANRKKSEQKQKKGVRRKKSALTIFLRVFIVMIIIGGFALGGAFLGAYMGIIESAPNISAKDAVPESYTSILYNAQGNEIDRLHGEENREYVKLTSIPVDLQQAVVAIEDERFYQHNGIDAKGMVRALFVNIKNMDMSQGASTITQQLIKNEVLTSKKTLERKLQEQYIAVNFEKELTKTLGSKTKAKDYILELYLNSIGLNHGLNGVQSASKFYFGKDVNELTLAESACIAGITKNPTAYSPLTNQEKNKQRQKLVLDKMLELEYITQAEYDTSIAEDVYSKIVGKKTDINEKDTANHNYFVDSAITELATQLENEKKMSRKQAYNLIYSGGLKIYLTIDDDMQKTMEDSFANDALFPPSGKSYTVTYTISVMDNKTEEQSHFSRTKEILDDNEIEPFVQSVKEELLNSTNTLVADNVSISRSLQAAMTIMDYRTGHIKAIVGGREKNGDLVFNRATQALRQPGSCFKVLASYAPAIDLGIVMPGTLIMDEPFTYNGWSPKNWYSSGYRGLCSVREGIRDSLNILAAKTIVQVGMDTAFDYLKNFGFTTLVESRTVNGKVYSDKGPAISLGGVTDGVTVLELTAAYGAIANQGVYTKPVFYTKVLDHSGNILIDNEQPQTHRVIKETTAYLLTDMMKDVISGGGTGGLARFSKVSMPIAGKTGTTSDDKDLIFAGYTPYYVAGIWMGYDQPKRMSYDKSYHLLLWKDVMEKVHTGLENKSFTAPNGIVTKSICSVSGNNPSELCEHDYFGNAVSTDIAAADAPGADKVCEVHKKFKICKEGLAVPSPNCPPESVIEVVLAVDEEGNVINNPKDSDGNLKEGAIDLKKYCEFTHEITVPEIPEIPGIDNTEEPSLPGLDNEIDNHPEEGLPGLTGLPGIN